jgi:hypothetical protein
MSRPLAQDSSATRVFKSAGRELRPAARLEAAR